MMLDNLFFLSGPHGAGKTVLASRLSNHAVVAELLTSTPKLHTEPSTRSILKVCQRAIENFETGELARSFPQKMILGNRCMYDVDAYAEVYERLKWISHVERDRVVRFAKQAFPVHLHQPLAIVLNPPFEVVRQRLEKRWSESGKKWREEDIEYCWVACEVYKRFKKDPRVFYVTDNDQIEDILKWMKKQHGKS